MSSKWDQFCLKMTMIIVPSDERTDKTLMICGLINNAVHGDFLNHKLVVKWDIY